MKRGTRSAECGTSKRQSTGEAFAELAIKLGCALYGKIAGVHSARERGWFEITHHCYWEATARHDQMFDAARDVRWALHAARSCGRGEEFVRALRCCFSRPEPRRAA